MIKTETKWIAISHDGIDLDGIDAFLRDPECGAVATFLGTTRRFTDGQETVELAYDAYEPMAVQEMERLADQAVTDHPVRRVAIHHRLGVVPVAEASVAIGVATPHRDAAFTACRFLIDTLKTQVPIWKREHYADGSTEWVEGGLPDAE
jgi:molybdopterin synthase catalytic subunit